MASVRESALRDLQRLPGVGKRVSEDLYSLGFRSAYELKGKNPEKLYADLCILQRQHIDRCMLYVLRCAVYFASHTRHDPEKLKWWNWKDK